MIQLDFIPAVILTSLFLTALAVGAYLFLRDAIAAGIAKDREAQERERQERGLRR